MSLTLIGYGFVGKAVYNSLKDSHDIHIVDPKYTKNNIQDKDADGYIICVPTPMRKDGRCEMSYVMSVMEYIPADKPILIKSTVCLEGWEALQDAYPNHLTSFSPEFLVAAQADEDFANQKNMLIGGASSQYWITEFSKRFPNMTFYTEDVKTLILTKYARNCFLSTKVAFFNDLYDLAEATGTDWEALRQMIGLDDRIGLSHTMVPGPDGKRGFGGACFPKDTAAFLKTGEYYNTRLHVLEAVVKQNKGIRRD